jgi:hypothetical protein
MAAPHAPYFHTDSGSVRFWVLVNDQPVGASVRRETLHYALRAGKPEADALETYRAHSQAIDDAVRRRVAQGSIEPVMLREFDLRPPLP